MGFKRVDWFCPRCAGWWAYGWFDPTDEDWPGCPRCTDDLYPLSLVERESPYWTGPERADDDRAEADGADVGELPDDWDADLLR